MTVLDEIKFNSFADECEKLGRYLIHEAIPNLFCDIFGEDWKPQILTYRKKKYNSFSSKLFRKNIENPINDVDDFFGIRIVFLRESELRMFEDKLKEIELAVYPTRIFRNTILANPEKFDYESDHYKIQCVESFNYNGSLILEQSKVELQVRTIFQHIYAEYSHMISYKRESEIKPDIKRLLSTSKALTEATKNLLECAESTINDMYKNTNLTIELCKKIYSRATNKNFINNNYEFHYYMLFADYYNSEFLIDIDDFFKTGHNSIILKEYIGDKDNYLSETSFIVLVIFLLKTKKTTFNNLWIYPMNRLGRLMNMMGIPQD